jgi:hypothetical protein
LTTKASRGRRPVLRARGAWVSVSVAALFLSVAPLVAAAPTDSPVLIRALAPAMGVDPTAEWAMLQMTVDGQEVAGETLTFYGPGGAVAGTYVVPSDVANELSQRAVLLATPSAGGQIETQYDGVVPDFVLPVADRLDPSGGALCLSGAFPSDCASWGSFPLASAQALSDPQHFNAAAILGAALGRWNGEQPMGGPSRGCVTWLGPSDDNNSAADFFDGIAPFPTSEPQPPQPRSNAFNPRISHGAEPPTAIPCSLNTLFNQTPSAPTNDTTPTFAFGEVPPEYGVGFQCRLGAGASLAPGLAWTSCFSSGNTFGPLADGVYSFQAYATGAAGPDPTPLNWTFEVDTVPPDTFIDSVPPSPSNGFSATFAFHSTEPQSHFICQYEAGPIQPCESPKTIFSLSDGSHAFRVWAIDQATNQDQSPAETTFSVDATLGDKSPPDTAIISKPKDPSSTATAAFTYRSNEARSTFQCRLDSAAFSPCPATGISYAALKNGEHSFAVKATDRAGNTDSVPASYSWTVKVALPETTITASPPGAQRIRGRARSTKVSFAFKSNREGSSFRCRLDKEPFATCKSPLKLTAQVGKHRFEVYAIDSLGNEEPTPTKRIFRVLAKRKSGGLFR